MSGAPQVNNGRQSDRMRTFMAARVSYAQGANVIECTIRNFSEGGAKLQISDSITLPGIFDLIIPQRNSIRRVRLCWRKEEFCGVAFMDEGGEAPQSVDAEHADVEAALRLKIRKLEATITQMQLRIDELSGG